MTLRPTSHSSQGHVNVKVTPHNVKVTVNKVRITAESTVLELVRKVIKQNVTNVCTISHKTVKIRADNLSAPSRGKIWTPI